MSNENLKVKGKLIHKLAVETGEGKNGQWQKQQFVIETEGDYPKQICIVLWGDKVDEIKKYKQGDVLDVSINIESREYNQRWYTDVKAWRIEGDASESVSSKTEQTPPKAAPLPESDDLPF